MHNIDRTVGEANYEYNNESYEMNPETYEYAGEFQGEDEFLNELNELPGETFETTGESYELPGESYEYAGESAYETGLSGEAMETELATELLGVSNEAELEQFLGSLIKRAAGAVRSFANSSAGRAIGGFLKSAAKKALPIVGRAAGTFFGGPLGGAIGGKLGSYASNLFELELEGLSNEDKEFELSKAYVRFANAAVRNAIRNPRARAYPVQAAKAAIIAAANRHAPGLLRRRPPFRGYPGATGFAAAAPAYAGAASGYAGAPAAGNGNSGTWYKRGNKIILNL